MNPIFNFLFLLSATFVSVHSVDRSGELLHRTLMFESDNFRDHYWNVRSTTQAHLDGSFDPRTLHASFTVVPGLHGQGVSFRTPNGRYLRHRNSWIFADKNDNSALFKLDASFHVENGIHNRNGYSFRSVNFPQHFIRHYGYGLRIDSLGSAPFAQDATFYSHNIPTDITSSILGRQVRLESENFRSFYLHARFDRSIYIDRSPAQAPYFNIVKGLAGQGVSFQAFDGSYLRHKGYYLYAHHNDHSDLFKKDATFIPIPGIQNKNLYSFRSFNFPNHYIRHASYRVSISNNYNAPFKRDATWDIRI